MAGARMEGLNGKVLPCELTAVPAMNTILALFIRALRQEARGKAAYWVRVGSAMLPLGLVVVTFIATGWSGATGKMAFEMVVRVDFILLALVGLPHFASAITEEKEAQTLPLLRMADAGPIAVLLGKSTSRLFSVALVAGAQIPLLIFTITLGGVSLGQIEATLVTMGALVFVSANVGLVSSTLFSRTLFATVGSGAFLAVLLFGGHVMSAWATASGAIAELGATWRELSPIVRADHVLATGFPGPVFDPAASVLLAVGTMCFLMAWLFFDRFADSVPSSELTNYRWVRIPRRLARVWDVPILWKEFHFVACLWLRPGSRVMLCLLAAVLVWTFGNRAIRMDFPFWLLVVIGSEWLLELAVCAGKIFRDELRAHTWPSLAGVPMTVGRIVWQKVLGCVVATWPQLLLCVSLAGWEIFSTSKLFWPNLGLAVTWWILPTATIILAASTLLYVTAWLSLKLDSFALPWAILTAIVGTAAVGGLFVLFFQEASEAMAPFALAFLVFVMHADIEDRLEVLAGTGG